MTPMLTSMYASTGGSEALDVLMKYLYGTLWLSTRHGIRHGLSYVSSEADHGFWASQIQRDVRNALRPFPCTLTSDHRIFSNTVARR